MKSWSTNPLGSGSTQVWYQKTSYLRNGMMGFKFCAEHGCLPNPKNLSATHVLLGNVEATDPERVFCAMQGENWSPEGEARELISSKGLGHTSMSVGDVVVVGGKAVMVDRFGFKDLPVPVAEDSAEGFPSKPARSREATAPKSALMDPAHPGKGRKFADVSAARKYGVAAEDLAGMKADFRPSNDPDMPYLVVLVPV